MNEKVSYELYLKEAAEHYEGLCKRCGACCGLFEKDPCTELVRGGDGRYYCRIYEERFGLRRTVRGNEFLCVPVRKVISGFWAGSYQCAYKKQLTGLRVNGSVS